jgi:hypothetical protein
VITVDQIRQRNVARRIVERVLHVCPDLYERWLTSGEPCDRCHWSPIEPGVVSIERIAQALIAMFGADAALFADALAHRIEELLRGSNR